MTDRLRGRKLQERRERHFRRFPLCVHCEERHQISIATQLDHIVPLFKGGEDDYPNLQGLCDPCHDAKTAQDMGHTQKPKTRIGPDGFPIP